MIGKFIQIGDGSCYEIMDKISSTGNVYKNNDFTAHHREVVGTSTEVLYLCRDYFCGTIQRIFPSSIIAIYDNKEALQKNLTQKK